MPCHLLQHVPLMFSAAACKCQTVSRRTDHRTRQLHSLWPTCQKDVVMQAWPGIKSCPCCITGGQDGEIELDLDSLSRRALWALHDLYISSGTARNGPPRKGGGGRSGTPGPPRAGSQAAQMANQPEVTSSFSNFFSSTSCMCQ